MMTIRLAVVESQSIVRYGLRELVSRHPDIEIVAECVSAAEAPEKLGLARADVVTLDVNLPDGDGLRLPPELRGRTAALRRGPLTARVRADILVRSA